MVAALALGAHTPAFAQRLTNPHADEPLLADPGGTRLGGLAAGAVVDTSGRRSGFLQVTLDGWIFSQSVQRAQRDGHNLQITKPGTENLRAAPNGRVVAQLVNGAYLDEVGRRGGWVHVRRALWIAVPVPAVAAAESTAADTAALGTDSGGAVDPSRGIVRRRIQLMRAPGGDASATLEPGTTVRVTARAGGWVRVEAQGWVRESDVRPANQSILTGISASELRATPDEFKGKLLRWTIQYIALQTADELRPDFAPGQKYILARGPAPEYAFVYIAVPDDKLDAVSHLAPLDTVTIVARVLNGRSMYLSNPVLELVDLPDE